MLRTVNRVLLGLVGLALAAAGAAVLLAGLDLPRPGFAPFGGPDDVLLSRAARQRWRDDGWWWPTVVGALAALLLACLAWLVAQLRRARLGEVVIDTGPDDDRSAEGASTARGTAAGGPAARGSSGGGPQAVLRGTALEEALAVEAEDLEGVERARVTLTGRRTAPRARFGVLLGPDAHPAAAVDHIESRALAQARTSVGLARLPAEIRFRAAKHHRPGRVT